MRRRVLSAALLVALAAGLFLTLAAGPGGALAQAKGDPSAGADVFQDRCALCHVASGGGQGPSLTGVLGRRAAALGGFHYSAALKASGLTWTPAALDRFLQGPGKDVPGTAMSAVVANPQDRADLISYLATKK